MKANKPGRPLEFDDAIGGRILFAIPLVITQRQVAAHAKIPPQTLKNWLIKGEKEANDNQDTILAQFWLNYIRARAEVVQELIQTLKSRPKVYQPIIFLLERCFREDFGLDSYQIQELIDNLMKLSNQKEKI